MTFTEAAAQVLRLVGKPLHYKEITDVAIERDLLSHVGKSPEVTMGARLAALVKKGDKDNPLVRIKPGVFALREWDAGTIERGLSDRTPALKMIEGQPTGTPAAEGSGDAEGASGPFASPGDDEGEEPPDLDIEERERAELAANAREIFAAEEDDDDPILGGPDEEPEGTEARGPGDDAAGGRRKRRRRRRSGRGPSGGAGGAAGGDDLPTYTVSDAGPSAAVARAPEANGAEGDGLDDDLLGALPGETQAQQPRRGRDGREREPRDREGRGRDGRDREARDREGREREAPEKPDGGAPLDELEGVSLADAAVELLAQFERQGPVPLRQLLDAARRRGRLAGDPQQALSALSASLRADNARRSLQGIRPRFRLSGGRVGLSEWLLDGELRRLEREVLTAVERYREGARRSLARRLQGLPPQAISELVMLLLEATGLSELQPVRRPGVAAAGELHLTGKAPGAVSAVQTAVVVRKDGRDVGREQVTDLRGNLHHFSGSVAGILVTTGQVLSGAREEAAAKGATPVRLVDGAALARLCEEHGVAVTSTQISLPLPDAELFESLRNGGG